MAEIVIHCIPQSGADPAEVAAELNTYLQDTDGVNHVMVKVEHPQVGLAEVLAVLQIATTAINLAEKLIGFIKSRQDKGKVKDIEVEIDGERVPIGSLTRKHSRLIGGLAYSVDAYWLTSAAWCVRLAACRGGLLHTRAGPSVSFVVALEAG